MGRLFPHLSLPWSQPGIDLYNLNSCIGRIAHLRETLAFTNSVTLCVLDVRWSPAPFGHVVRSCSEISHYWEAVAETLSDISGLTITLDLPILLLSYLEDAEGDDRYTNLCLTFTLILCKKGNFDTMEVCSSFYSRFYIERNKRVDTVQRKFDKICSNWIDACRLVRLDASTLMGSS